MAIPRRDDHAVNVRNIELLAKRSHQTDFSVDCCCEDEARCHRSVLRELLLEHGARLC